MRNNILRAVVVATAAIAGAALTGCDGSAPATGSSTGAATAGETRKYTLDTCLVSGEKLGSMGEPVVLVHQGQEVKLCCKSCKPDFEKEPSKFLSKLGK